MNVRFLSPGIVVSRMPRTSVLMDWFSSNFTSIPVEAGAGGVADPSIGVGFSALASFLLRFLQHSPKRKGTNIVKAEIRVLWMKWSNDLTTEANERVDHNGRSSTNGEHEWLTKFGRRTWLQLCVEVLLVSKFCSMHTQMVKAEILEWTASKDLMVIRKQSHRLLLTWAKWVNFLIEAPSHLALQ